MANGPSPTQRERGWSKGNAYVANISCAISAVGIAP